MMTQWQLNSRSSCINDRLFSSSLLGGSSESLRKKMPWIVSSCLSDAATCFRREGRRNERGTNGPNFLSFLCLKAAPCEVHVWHSLPLIAKLASHFLPPRARPFVFPPPGFFRRSICAKNVEFSALRVLCQNGRIRISSPFVEVNPRWCGLHTIGGRGKRCKTQIYDTAQN